MIILVIQLSTFDGIKLRGMEGVRPPVAPKEGATRKVPRYIKTPPERGGKQNRNKGY